MSQPLSKWFRFKLENPEKYKAFCLRRSIYHADYVKKRREDPERFQKVQERNKLRDAQRRRNPEVKLREKVYGIEQKRKRQQFLNLLKLDRPCYDCGGMFHTDAMEWDHLPGREKFFQVGSSYSLESCLEEINKCQLVCANCHRVRTATRKQERAGVVLSES